MSALTGFKVDGAGRIPTSSLAPTSYFRGMGIVTAAGASSLHTAPALLAGAGFNGSVFTNPDGGVPASTVAAIAGYSSGLPMSAAGELCVDSAAAVTQFNQGVPLTAAGRVAITVVSLNVLQQMTVQSHDMTAEQGVGQRVGYLRNGFGSITPNDVPNLVRLVSMNSNHRVILDVDGDFSSTVLLGMGIQPLPAGAPTFLPPPDMVNFNGATTQFRWANGSYNFVDGTSYRILLF